jgi:hypothetical protein
LAAAREHFFDIGCKHYSGGIILRNYSRLIKSWNNTGNWKSNILVEIQSIAIPYLMIDLHTSD